MNHLPIIIVSQTQSPIFSTAPWEHHTITGYHGNMSIAAADRCHIKTQQRFNQLWFGWTGPVSMPQTAEFTLPTRHHNTIVCYKHREFISTANSEDKNERKT